MEKMKTLVLIYAFLQISYQSNHLFDIEELKSFNYGIDISSVPVVMKSEDEDISESNVVLLTSKYGQPYQCSFPDTVENDKQKEEAEKVAMETGIPDLLKPMESGPCLKKTQDWWSYQFCYGKQIKQFHLTEDGRIEGETILLGYYESEYNWDEDAEVKSDSEKRQSKMRRYHTQQYVNGSKCDLNGKQRRTEVRFICEEGSADYIARLDEPETCVYIMTIHTMKICHHPFLKPPMPTKTVTITCNPLLTVIQYQEYLDQLDAKERQEQLEKEKQEEQEELERQIQEEKAKYYKENQLHTDEDDEDGEVETESEIDAEIFKKVKEAQKLFDEDGTKEGDDEEDQEEIKTMFKVIESPEDLKDFLKDTVQQMKKLQENKKKAKTGVTKEIEEDEEDEEEKIIEPDVPRKGTHWLDDPDLEELDSEIKTLKDRYRNRRDRLTEIKKRVRSSMQQQYESIIKEAQEELGQEGDLTEEAEKENRMEIRQLTKTIDNLLNKLDKTEKEIEEVDKELEQFAEYDSEEKDVKSVPPVKLPDPQSSAKGPTKTEAEDNRVKVRVSRLDREQKNKLLTDEKPNKQTLELERSVQKELEKAGLGNGEKIQVKIITASYADGDDDTLHVLSEQESEAFRNMIVDMIGGQSEVDRETVRQDKQEEHYSFVWGQDSKYTDSQTDTTETNTRYSQTYTDDEDDILKESEDS